MRNTIEKPKEAFDRLNEVLYIKSNEDYWSMASDILVVDYALADYEKQKKLLDVLSKTDVTFILMSWQYIDTRNPDGWDTLFKWYNERYEHNEEFGPLTEDEFELIRWWLE